LLEDGVDIRVILARLVHAKLDNAALYTKVAMRTVRAVAGLLDKLAMFAAWHGGPGDWQREPTSLEVAEIFRNAGFDCRPAHAGHLTLHQLKVMSATEQRRTAALRGHVETCDD